MLHIDLELTQVVATWFRIRKPVVLIMKLDRREIFYLCKCFCNRKVKIEWYWFEEVCEVDAILT